MSSLLRSLLRQELRIALLACSQGLTWLPVGSSHWQYHRYGLPVLVSSCGNPARHGKFAAMTVFASEGSLNCSQVLQRFQLHILFSTKIEWMAYAQPTLTRCISSSTQVWRHLETVSRGLRSLRLSVGLPCVWHPQGTQIDQLSRFHSCSLRHMSCSQKFLSPRSGPR